MPHIIWPSVIPHLSPLLTLLSHSPNWYLTRQRTFLSCTSLSFCMQGSSPRCSPGMLLQVFAQTSSLGKDCRIRPIWNYNTPLHSFSSTSYLMGNHKADTLWHTIKFTSISWYNFTSPARIRNPERQGVLPCYLPLYPPASAWLLVKRLTIICWMNERISGSLQLYLFPHSHYSN